MAKAQQDASNEQLVNDMKKLVDSMEDLIGDAGGNAESKVVAMRNKAENMLSQVRDNYQQAKETVKEKTEVASRRTDNYVKENPWSSVGIAAGVGLVVGLLISGRR